MRQYVRCRLLTIPSKLNLSIRIVIDQRSEFRSISDSGESIGLILNPVIEVQINRPKSLDGPRVWNPNDTLMLTRLSLPLFIRDLESVMDSLKLTEMFVYTGERLELNPKLAEEKRKIFRSNQSFYVEIIPSVVETEEKRVEGIRFTFNKEPSLFYLTIPELESFLYALKTVQPDVLSLLLYTHYQKTGSNEIVNPFPPQF